MPRNNEGCRRGGNCRKLGDLKTCKEGASFVLSETVRQAKKKGDEEEGGRPGNKAEVRQLRGEIRELKTKMGNQAEIIKLLQAALIGSMSRTMYDEYKGKLKEEFGNPEDTPEDRKQDMMTKAKHEAIVKVAVEMIYLTHLGSEKTFEPSKLAVEAFKGVVGFNNYQHKDMAYEEKAGLYDGELGVQNRNHQPVQG